MITIFESYMWQVLNKKNKGVEDIKLFLEITNLASNPEVYTKGWGINQWVK